MKGINIADNIEFIKKLYKELIKPNITNKEKRKYLELIENSLYLYKFKSPLGVISDTHIGNKNDNLEYIKRVYDYFYHNNISNIIHAGDLFDGLYEYQDIYEFEKQKEIGEIQIENFKNNYPKGFNNFVTFGNHDEMLFKIGFDLNKLIADFRNDFIPLGLGSGYFLWYSKKVQVKHWVSKNHMAFKGIFSNLVIKGHSHSFKYVSNKTSLKVPTCSDIHPCKINSTNDLPGFLILNQEKGFYSLNYYILEDKVIKKVLEKVELRI